MWLLFWLFLNSNFPNTMYQRLNKYPKSLYLFAIFRFPIWWFLHFTMNQFFELFLLCHYVFLGSHFYVLLVSTCNYSFHCLISYIIYVFLLFLFLVHIRVSRFGLLLAFSIYYQMPNCLIIIWIFYGELFKSHIDIFCGNSKTEQTFLFCWKSTKHWID